MCGSEWGSEWNPMAEEMGIVRGSGIGDCQKVRSYSNTPTTILLLRLFDLQGTILHIQYGICSPKPHI